MCDVYDTRHKYHVIKYLTRMFTHDVGIEYYESRTISDEHVNILFNNIIPKPLKPPPALDFGNDQIKLDAIRYLIKQYGDNIGMQKWIDKDLSLYDKKMIHSMYSIFMAYQNIGKSRSNTHLVNERPMIVTVEKKDKKIGNKEKDKKTDNVLCTAYKMNGTICNAIIKNKDAKYCGRHLKKNVSN
jgi:hypothetical protein